MDERVRIDASQSVGVDTVKAVVGQLMSGVEISSGMAGGDAGGGGMPSARMEAAAVGSRFTVSASMPSRRACLGTDSRLCLAGGSSPSGIPGKVSPPFGLAHRLIEALPHGCEDE